jgi:hypothetical protein
MFRDACDNALACWICAWILDDAFDEIDSMDSASDIPGGRINPPFDDVPPALFRIHALFAAVVGLDSAESGRCGASGERYATLTYGERCPPGALIVLSVGEISPSVLYARWCECGCGCFGVDVRVALNVACGFEMIILFMLLTIPAPPPMWLLSCIGSLFRLLRLPNSFSFKLSPRCLRPNVLDSG